MAGTKRKRHHPYGEEADLVPERQHNYPATLDTRQYPFPSAPLPFSSNHLQWHQMPPQLSYNHNQDRRHFELDKSHECGELKICNNPECEDVQPCPADLDPCFDPQQCLGNICYDEHCAPNYTCDQNCETETGCATPCYSNECNVPACPETCPATMPPPSMPPVPRHAQRGNEALCTGSTCQIPGQQCVDPQCLTLDYVPAVHTHHDLATYYKFMDQHQAITNPSCTTTSCCDYLPAICTSFGGHGQHSCFHDAHSSWPDCVSHQSYPLAPSLQPLLDWNSMNMPCTPGRRGTTTDTESIVPSLSDSLTATPITPAFRSLSETLSPTPLPTGQPPVCQWTDGRQPCGRVFQDAAELHAHVESAHIGSLKRDNVMSGADGFYCQWHGCNRNAWSSGPAAFTARPKLKRHMQTHTGHKPFVCPICNMAMKTKDAMEKHERTHNGARPYQCPVDGCSKRFATSTELKTHMVVHSGRKPHICPICGEGFADSSNLSKHRKTHYVGMFRCPDENCGARMKRWDQMRRHIASQGHCKYLLDDKEAEREYKDRMEREYNELPDDQKRSIQSA